MEESNFPDVELMRLVSNSQCSNPLYNIYRTDRTRTCDTKLRRLVFLFQLNYSPKRIIVLVMQTIITYVF